MGKLIKFFVRVILLFAAVLGGFLAVREWQRNKTKYKAQLTHLANKVKNNVDEGRDAAYDKAIELRRKLQKESTQILSEAAVTAEKVKASEPVQKAVDFIEKSIPGEQFPDRKTVKELTPRQNIIYAIIKGKKQVEMKDLLMRVSGVTERTLRRDLLRLQALKLVSKKGTTKAVTYVLK